MKIPADKLMHLQGGAAVALALLAVVAIAVYVSKPLAVAAGSVIVAIGIELYQKWRHEGEPSWAEAAASALPGAELVAEYQSGSSGWVREALSTGQQAGQRVLRFTLPPTLKGRANGPVCLYIQVTTNRALLPVRKPGQLGEDSARFRYPEWEQAAFENTAKQLKQNELTALNAHRAQLDTTLAQQTKALEQRGWQTEAHCDRNLRADGQPRAAAAWRLAAREAVRCGQASLRGTHAPRQDPATAHGPGIPDRAQPLRTTGPRAAHDPRPSRHLKPRMMAWRPVSVGG